MSRQVLNALSLALLVGACSDYRPGPVGDSGTAPRDTAGDTPSGPDRTAARGGAGGSCEVGQCGAPLGCDPYGQEGFCSRSCADHAASADEERQCGGAGSTCLSQGTVAQAVSLCTHACDPAARTEAEGGCRADMVCTGWWYTRDDGPDRTGCFPFCERDADCASVAPYTICNTRVHLCMGTPVDLALLPDGEPCDPTAVTTIPGDSSTRNHTCRGYCTAVEPGRPTRGICASRINLARTTTCPDHPSVQAFARRGQDNLGICVFKPCADDRDCTSPLRCLFASGAGRLVCIYPPA